MNNFTLTSTAKESKSNHLFQNPVMKKFAKIQEQSDEHITYSGVAKKCGFFVLMIIAGVVLTFLTNFFCSLTNNFDGEYPLPVVALAGISSLAFLVTPFIAIFAKKTTPVTGSIFCASVGVVYSASALFVDSYRNEILLAMFLTVALFIALTALFAFDIIKPGQKLKSTMYILFATLFIAAILMGIAMFIPALSGAATAITTSPVWCIAIGLLGVTLASLFILSDLQKVREAVDNNVPKTYEWDAAFGIVFSVIWLFAEMLQLITSTKDVM